MCSLRIQGLRLLWSMVKLSGQSVQLLTSLGPEVHHSDIDISTVEDSDQSFKKVKLHVRSG